MSDDSYGGVGLHADAALGSGKHRGPRFSWNPSYEETFFRSLCESVQMGLREGTVFKQEAWDRALHALIERHNAFANKGHLINKSDNARKKFRLWRGLREDAQFHYNPETRMVSAPDDVWTRHIEREPLSRSLKGRPFDHEQYYEILYPDVIGSGGIPRRVTKTRRKTDSGTLMDEPDGPGNTLLDFHLLTDVTYDNTTNTMQQQQQQQPPPPPQSQHQHAQHSQHLQPSQHTQHPPHMQHPPQHTQQHPQPTRQLSSNVHQAVAPHQAQQRPSSTVIPPRTTFTSTSALTPPEENMPQSHKRYLSTTDANGVVSGQTPNKRQRNAPPPQLFGDRMNNQGLGQTQTQTQTPTQTHDHSLNVNHGHMQSNPTNAVAVPVTASAPTPAIPSTTTTPSSTSTFAPPPSASILPSSSTTAAATLSSSHAPPPATMAPTAAAPTAASAHHHHHHHPPLPPAGGPDAPPAIHPWAAVTVRWQEQAMDLFFRDFADEDSDLQIKIGEKVLTDENKAMLFCKMPPQLRRHYVKRLREAHNRIA